MGACAASDAFAEARGFQHSGLVQHGHKTFHAQIGCCTQRSCACTMVARHACSGGGRPRSRVARALLCLSTNLQCPSHRSNSPSQHGKVVTAPVAGCSCSFCPFPFIPSSSSLSDPKVSFFLQPTSLHIPPSVPVLLPRMTHPNGASWALPPAPNLRHPSSVALLHQQSKCGSRSATSARALER